MTAQEWLAKTEARFLLDHVRDYRNGNIASLPPRVVAAGYIDSPILR